MRRMVQGRTSTVLAFVLGLVIATAATAGAARLITGKQIKDGSISAKDLSRAVRAQLAKAGTPGPPGPAGKDGAPNPNAENAAQLGGLAPDAFLRSDRLLSGSVQYASGSVGKVLFRDPATGLEVRAGDQGRPRLVNTNGEAELFVRGVGWFVPGNLYGYDATIQAGNFTQVTFDATGFNYGQFMVVKWVADGSPAPRLQLTCAFKDSAIPAQNVLSCVGVR